MRYIKSAWPEAIAAQGGRQCLAITQLQAVSDVIICSPLSFSQHSENISVFCFIVAPQSFGFRISILRKCSCVSIAIKPESVRGLWGVAQWIWNLETETVECMRFHSCLCITTENGGKSKDYNYDTRRWEEAHVLPNFCTNPFWHHLFRQTRLHNPTYC